MEKDRLHEVVVRLDHQLMNAQPSDARCMDLFGMICWILYKLPGGWWPVS